MTDVVTPVGYRSKSSAVYEELRHRIMTGELTPGAAINQEGLAAALGVSTTPLREALRRLETEGLVISLAHQVVRIQPLRMEELVSIYEVRTTLDALAARLAAERHTEAEAARMRTTAAESSSRSKDPLGANRAFHAAVYHASHNEVLIAVLDALWDRSDRYRRLAGSIATKPQVRREHADLLDAVLGRDGTKAAHLMEAHLASTVEVAREELQRSNLLDSETA